MAFRKSSKSKAQHWAGQHRFEHWYRDNTVYFITARCRNRTRAFETESAKVIFWNRFDHFTPWVTSLLNNHYHTEGYLRFGRDLGQMTQKIHGSVTKLVNDLLEVRLLPFWTDGGNQNYFDGCIRDELQARRAISLHVDTMPSSRNLL